MAQKKVQTRDEVVSKTARASAVKAGKGAFARSAEAPLLVSLNGTEHCYFFHPLENRCIRMETRFLMDRLEELPEELQQKIGYAIVELAGKYDGKVEDNRWAHI